MPRIRRTPASTSSTRVDSPVGALEPAHIEHPAPAVGIAGTSAVGSADLGTSVPCGRKFTGGEGSVVPTGAAPGGSPLPHIYPPSAAETLYNGAPHHAATSAPRASDPVPPTVPAVTAPITAAVNAPAVIGAPRDVPPTSPSISEEKKDTIKPGADWAAMLVACRNDVNTFVEFVMKSDKLDDWTPALDAATRRGIDGPPIRQHTIHEQMHAAVEEHRRVVIMGFPESGKSVQIGQGRLLHQLGLRPDHHFGIVGNTQNAAKKTLEPIKRYIENSEQLRAVFPHLKPGNLWRDDRIVVDRSTASRDPSIQTVGYHGDIQGSRLNGIVIDDLLDFETTRTDQARREVMAWLKSSVLMRSANRAWVAFLTNAWHEKDAAHELIKEGWYALKFAVMDSAGKPTWPDIWPLSRIREMMTTLGPLDFARTCMNKARDDASKIFLPESIAMCRERGEGYSLVDELSEGVRERHGRDLFILTGIDIGAAKVASGGQTVCTSIVVHPNGNMQPVRISASRRGNAWLMPEVRHIAMNIGGIIVVEDNGTQSFIADGLRSHFETENIEAHIVPFQTGSNKHDQTLGMASMAAEFDAQKFIIPGEHNEHLEGLIDDMDTYTHGAHTGDYLMSLWFARTYAKRLLMMRTMKKRDPFTVRVVG